MSVPVYSLSQRVLDFLKSRERALWEDATVAKVKAEEASAVRSAIETIVEKHKGVP